MEEKDRPIAERGDILARAGRLCRTVAAALIAGLTRRDDNDVEARLARRPRGEQALIVGLTLLGLFLTSLLFAQFGWIGMLVFFLIVVLLVR